MLIRPTSTTVLWVALLVTAVSAEEKTYRQKFFGEDQLQKPSGQTPKPNTPPPPPPPSPAPEAENYGADYGRDSRVTPREELAGGKREPKAQDAPASTTSRPVGATDLAGAEKSQAFPAGEKPRDSVRSAPRPENVAMPPGRNGPESPLGHAGPTLAAASLLPTGAASRPKPPTPAALGRVFDASPSRPELAEPKAMPRPWAAGAAAKPGPGALKDSPGVSRPGGPALVNLPPDASAAPAPVFVAMELDLSANPGQYRDAVAALGKTAGFKLDARFPPLYRDSRRNQVSVWGWVPAAQVTQALTSPGVQRLEAAPQGQAPAPAAAPEGEWRLVLRLPVPKPGSEDPATEFAGTLLRLNEAGFAWKRSEPRDSAGLVAVIGTMPAGSLTRVMADASVVRMEPVRNAPAAPAPAPLEASAGPVALFGRFVSTHPVFVLLLALAPLVVRLLKRES